jgi:protein SCO1/2
MRNFSGQARGKIQGWRARMIVALALVSLALATSATATAQTVWGRDYFPNATLTTQDNQKVKFFDDVLDGKVVVINFIFTTCVDVCPLDTAQLRKVYDLLGDHPGKDIFFYSISVDPERDTPEAMTSFMKQYEIGKGWTFLTGKQADIDLIQKKLGFAPAGDSPSAHSTSIMLANVKTGEWIKRSPYENPQLIANMLARLNGNGRMGDDKSAKRPYAEAVAVSDPSVGGRLYRTRCASCHTIGDGDTLGPDLYMVTQRRQGDWLARWIKAPDKMIAAGDPIAKAQMAQFRNLPMPNLKLADGDVAALIAFIDLESNIVSAQREADKHAGHHDHGAAGASHGGHDGHDDHAPAAHDHH